MKRLAPHAARVLNLLPFAQEFTSHKPPAALLAAVALVNNPMARRIAPQITAVATVGLAAIAVASFVSSMRRKPVPVRVPAKSGPDLVRSSAT